MVLSTRYLKRKNNNHPPQRFGRQRIQSTYAVEDYDPDATIPEGELLTGKLGNLLFYPYACICFCVACVAQAPQSDGSLLSPRIDALARALENGHGEALSVFWKENASHAPLIEPYAADNRLVLLTYIWRGGQETSSVGVLGDVPINGSYALRRLGATDLWLRTEVIPKDARFGYELCDNWRCARDPLNPNWWNAIGRSVVELPDAPAETWIKERPDVPRGKLSLTTLRSESLGEERPIAVYTPPGYTTGDAPYNLLIVFDGQGYGIDTESPIPTPTILNNLLFKNEIGPTVAILVSNIDQLHRNRDLQCSSAFGDFLAQELVPWAVKNYHAGMDASRVVVAGSSLGGLAAGCAAYQHPTVFGNVLSQSGTFAYSPDRSGGESSYFLTDSNWLARKISLGPRLPVRFFLSVGRLEGGSASSGLLENRRLRDVLLASGAQVFYREYTGSHDALTWRNSLADGLIALFGPDRLQDLR